MGVAPIQAGCSTTRIAVLDLDSHHEDLPWDEMTRFARQIADILETDEQLIANPFRSSGGHGIHLIYLWDQAQDAYSVRAVIREVLGRIDFHDGTRGVRARQFELFPKQDHVPIGGYGNYFLLPLTGQSVPLDARTFATHEREHILAFNWQTSRNIPVVAPIYMPTPSLPPDVGLDVLRSAVAAIPNSGDDELGYDEWWRIIVAIHHATGGDEVGRALAHEFSARASKYNPQFLDVRIWPYIRHHCQRPITLGTILYRAREYGWTDDVRNDFEDLGPIVANQDESAPYPPVQRNKTGTILTTQANLHAMLSRPDIMGLELGYDSFYGTYMIKQCGSAWTPFSDSDYTRIRARLEAVGFSPTLSLDRLKGQILVVAEDNRFDSAQEWLHSLSWDGTSRVETFCITHLGADDTDYARAVGVYLWSALAGRLIAPGSKADMVPVLVGEQGIRKSSAIAAMSPQTVNFSEINLDIKDDDLARFMRGKIIGECAELRGLSTRAAEHIKAFVTKTCDEWIEKYREFPTRYLRRIVLIGSTNEDSFLSDRTGNRRWLPIRVGVVSHINVDQIVIDRDQLWAEGAALYRLDGIAYQEAERLAMEHQIQDDYLTTDTWVTAIGRWLDTSDGTPGNTPRLAAYLLPQDVLTSALGIEIRRITRNDEIRLGSTMRELGYRKARMLIGQNRVYVYRPQT